jgi:hypothetical protein
MWKFQIYMEWFLATVQNYPPDLSKAFAVGGALRCPRLSLTACCCPDAFHAHIKPVARSYIMLNV